MPLNPTAWFDIAGRNRSQRAFAEVNQGLNTIRKTGLGLGKVLTGLAGFTALAKSAMSMASELSNTSDKLGISTEFLQGWSYAADRFDISAGAAGMALQRFSRRIAEANQGTGELKNTVAELGLNLQDNAGNLRPIEAILRDYANAIQNAATDADRLRLAFKAFDSEGAALVSVLRGGSAALDEWMGKAKDSGRIMDESVVKALADANKHLDDFKAKLTIVAGNFAGAFIAPDYETRTKAKTSLVMSGLAAVDDISGQSNPQRAWRPGRKVRHGVFPELKDFFRQSDLPSQVGPEYFPNRSSEINAYREYMRNQGQTNEFLQKIEDHLRAVRAQTQTQSSQYAY
jgi:hypothetical protein